MTPFNVKIMAILTRAVNTNFYANARSNDFKLPPTSRYLPLEETVRKYANGEDHTAVSARQYADKVVGDILGGAKGKIWNIG
jgi:1-acylglycerone phosphate reductase